MDNVNDIRIYSHVLLFTFNGPDDEAFTSYQDNAGKPTYNHRELTTEEIKRLKNQLNKLMDELI